MHKTMKHVDKLCDLKEKLMCGLESEFAKGFTSCSLHECGEVVDMIKDLAEAEEKCWKACYYKSIVEAMEEAEEYWEDMDDDAAAERRGYDAWRYSSGRFAPKGMGHKSGSMGNRRRAGYRDDMDMTDGRMHDGMHDTMPMRPWDRYKDAKRYYTETHDQAKKEEMERHADEHIKQSVESMKEMWNDASPNLKAKLKNQLTGLINTMN